jgi:molybdopterin molybdotransferase
MKNEDSRQPRPSCSDDFDPAILAAEDAARRIEALVSPVPEYERVAVRSALDRTLAKDVYSTVNVPAHTNSAMDGYALRSADLPADGSRTTLKVIGTAWAGRPYHGSAKEKQCVRIMTGAKMPDGLDTVIMQEQVECVDDTILIGSGHKPGQNVRQAGEDLAVGAVAVSAGTRIDPAELGLFASLGVAEVEVARRLRVAFFSTGDELRSIGEPLAEGEIYDSNRYTLHGMLTRLGVELLDMGVIADQREAIGDAFRRAASMADVIITSGGVSVGEADYIKEILAETGTVDFWKLAIKPGRPLAFGTVRDAFFFGLPGNPVAVMVTFYEFVQPALRRMMGQQGLRPARFRVPCRSRLKKRPGRMEFQRGLLQVADNGSLSVSRTGAQGSGMLSSMSSANCFIILPTDSGSVEPGDMVDVEPFEGLV